MSAWNLHARPHPPGIENTLWIETVLHPLRQCRQSLVLRLEHVVHRMERPRCLDQGCMAAERASGFAYEDRLRLPPFHDPEPDEPARPVVEDARRHGVGD